MKKPLAIGITLAAAAAYAAPYFSPSGSGGQDPLTLRVQALMKSGKYDSAQAVPIAQEQLAAEARKAETDSAMKLNRNPGPMQPAFRAPEGHVPPTVQAAPPPDPAAQVQQPGPQGQPGMPGQAKPQAPAPPMYHLKGVMLGGRRPASALFNYPGWGTMIMHVGDPLDERTTVVSIRKDFVEVRIDKKRTETLQPY